MSTLERAIAIAAEAHAGQVDKGGAPYILHPLRVMMAVQDDEEQIVAVLHDVLEDSPEWNLARLIEEGFSTRELDAVWALTKRRGEAYTTFIERLKPNALARAVKLADLADNSDMSRIPDPDEKDMARLAKYRRAIATLSAADQPDSQMQAEGRRPEPINTEPPND